MAVSDVGSVVLASVGASVWVFSISRAPVTADARHATDAGDDGGSAVAVAPVAAVPAAAAAVAVVAVAVAAAVAAVAAAAGAVLAADAIVPVAPFDAVAVPVALAGRQRQPRLLRLQPLAAAAAVAAADAAARPVVLGPAAGLARVRATRAAPANRVLRRALDGFRLATDCSGRPAELQFPAPVAMPSRRPSSDGWYARP